jgi:hypothetical protein
MLHNFKHLSPAARAVVVLLFLLLLSAGVLALTFLS